MKTLLLMILSFVVGFVIALFYKFDTTQVVSDEMLDTMLSGYQASLTNTLSGSVSLSGVQASAQNYADELKQSLTLEIEKKKLELKAQAKESAQASFKNRLDSIFK